MRRRSHPALFASSVAWILVACSPAPEVARYTVPQYRADPALREEQLAACANDPGTLGKSPDCINAREAKRLEESHSLRESPSLGLSSGADGERASGDDAPSQRRPQH